MRTGMLSFVSLHFVTRPGLGGIVLLTKSLGTVIAPPASTTLLVSVVQ
jgi:hypothetical protein